MKDLAKLTVWCHFQQIEQIVVRGDTSKTPPDLMRFVRCHAGITEGGTLADTYDFSQAQVDLVSVVPGRDALPLLGPDETRWLYAHCGRDPDLVSALPCAACEAKRRKLRRVCSDPPPADGSRGESMERIMYGMQRVRQVLNRNEHLLSRCVAP
jgi:hypothetical protein